VAVERANQSVQPPAWFYQKLPKIPFEGYLLFGPTSSWKEATIVVMDNPTDMESKYEGRIESLKKFLPSDNYVVRLVKRTLIQGQNTFDLLQLVKRNGGKGLLLRQPNSYFHDKDSLFVAQVQSCILEILRDCIGSQ
jgi:hypothetical protein